MPKQEWRDRFVELMLPRLAGNDGDKVRTMALVADAFDQCFKEGIKESAAFISDIGNRDPRIGPVAELLADGLRKFEAAHTVPEDGDRLMDTMDDIERAQAAEPGFRR